MRFLMALSLATVTTLASAQDRSQARSMVISTGGIMATSQTLASQKTRQALEAKGQEFKVQGDFSNEMSGGQAAIHNSATW